MPSNLSMASAFDAAVARRLGEAVGAEARATGGSSWRNARSIFVGSIQVTISICMRRRRCRRWPNMDGLTTVSKELAAGRLTLTGDQTIRDPCSNGSGSVPSQRR